jgi:hypothetical protein
VNGKVQLLREDHRERHGQDDGQERRQNHLFLFHKMRKEYVQAEKEAS